MTTPTTPAMTAQEIVKHLRGKKWAIANEAGQVVDDPIPYAAADALDRLSDAERRATEAETENIGIASDYVNKSQELSAVQSRLSAVEARCGRMREALEALRTWVGVIADKMDLDPDGTRVTINAVGPNGRREVAARSLREMYAQVDSILAYPGGKSDENTGATNGS